jgi:hypothetical protein
MIEKKLGNPQLEDVFDLVAEAIDAAGEEKRALFLAKLALALANMLGDPAALRQAVTAASRDL